MRQRIKDFRSGSSFIGAVVGDLESLVWELQQTPEEWRSRFIEALSELEIAYAMALDQGGRMPTADDPLIVFALKDLDALLDERDDSG